MAKKKEEAKALLYKGRQLVKRGNVVIYGDVNDEYYLRMTILKTKMIEDVEVGTYIYIELISSKDDKTVKKAERQDMFEALDIGGFWLEDALGAGKTEGKQNDK